MRGRRTAALVAAAAIATGLAACGGDDEDEGGSAAAPADTAADTGAAPKTTAEESGGEAQKGADGLTPPGTKLAFGETATVGWKPASGGFGADAKTIDLEVTVESVEKRSIDDLKDVNLDAEQKKATPYFVKVKIANVGGGKVSDQDDPDVTLDAIDDRGQEQGSITFIGDFPPCEDEQPPKPFTKGKSYESCLTYLVPGGGSIEEMRWKDGPAKENGVSEYFEKPVVWSGG